MLRQSYAVEQVLPTAANPQLNRIKERMHLTMVDMLRTMKFTVRNDSEGAWRTEVDAASEAVAWAIRSTVNTNTRLAPANLLFKRDMILNKEVTVNWNAIRQQREKEATVDNQRENASRKDYKYKEGSKCWIVKK